MRLEKHETVYNRYKTKLLYTYEHWRYYEAFTNFGSINIYILKEKDQFRLMII